MSVQSFRQQPVPPNFDVPVAAALAPEEGEPATEKDRRPTAPPDSARDLIEPQWIAAIAAGTD